MFFLFFIGNFDIFYCSNYYFLFFYYCRFYLFCITISSKLHQPHLVSSQFIIDDFQSAYKAGHSCETALLRVFNDIASTIGKGNGNLLVLLDLPAAFHTIDHVILFAILKKYIGFDGKALKLIMFIFLIALSGYRSMAFSPSLQVLCTRHI